MRSAGACRIGKWQRLEAGRFAQASWGGAAGLAGLPWLGWVGLGPAAPRVDNVSAWAGGERGSAAETTSERDLWSALREVPKLLRSYLSGAGEARLSEPKKLTHIAFPGPQLRFSEGGPVNLSNLILRLRLPLFTRASISASTRAFRGG